MAGAGQAIRQSMQVRVQPSRGIHSIRYRSVQFGVHKSLDKASADFNGFVLSVQVYILKAAMTNHMHVNNDS